MKNVALIALGLICVVLAGYLALTQSKDCREASITAAPSLVPARCE